MQLIKTDFETTVPARGKVRRVRFQAGSSTPLHLIGVELEKVGDLFSFPKPGRFMLYYPPKRKD